MEKIEGPAADEFGGKEGFYSFTRKTVPQPSLL